MRFRAACLLMAVLYLFLAGCRQEARQFIPTVTAPSEISPAASTPVVESPPADTQLFLPLTASRSTMATASPTATRLSSPTIAPTPAYPIYEGPPLNRADIGVQIHLHRENVPRIFRHLQALGVGWVKVQISWKLYQPYPDTYSDERFQELDTLVAAAEAHDIAVLLSASKAPEWSRPTTELDGPPTDYSLYRSFMEHLATRYQGRIGAYELWNEPNLQREWNGSPLSAADLVALIKMGAAGVRAVDSHSVLISSAPGATGINDGFTAIDDRVYFREMLAAGVADVVDVIGAHPYGWANPPDSRVSAPDPAVPSHQDHPSFFFQDTLFDYAALLEEFGLEKQIWVTEFGWGSFDGFEAGPPPGAEFMTAVSEWQQATYILRAYELAQEWDWVGPMFLWNLNFGPLLDTDYTESGYSLLRPDGTRRPAYKALAAAAKW